jgi:hypothetical protein
LYVCMFVCTVYSLNLIAELQELQDERVRHGVGVQEIQRAHEHHIHLYA